MHGTWKVDEVDHLPDLYVSPVLRQALLFAFKTNTLKSIHLSQYYVIVHFIFTRN